MKKFKSITELINHVKSESKPILESVAKEYVVPEMLDQIKKTVYDDYTPTGNKPYIRREGNDGLLDIDNIKVSDVEDYKNSISVFIKNEAKVSGKKYSKNGFAYELDWLIVEGASDWKYSQWYGIKHSRDFYSATRDAIEKELTKELAKRFEAKGMNVAYTINLT